VKRDSPVPVATADHWKTFLDHPELVDSVDQVFAHILPYWEGMPKGTAVDGSLALYNDLRTAYPGKKIVIGEFGWPSAGHNFERAVPGPISQAVILRNFVARANEAGIDYNIVEAIDQPQKLFEGNVGPYWGINDASLRPKFAWTGPIVASRLNEMATVALGREPTRLLSASLPAPAAYMPKVSIHIPAYREPPDMLLRTIDSVAQLDYPDFECVVVINNTPDPAFWQPIEKRCRELGPRFKFVCVQNLRGFKAA